MADDAVTAAAVDTLVQARRAGRPVAAPALPDVAAAYAVQDGVARALGWFGGAEPRHWKSGGPSREAPLTHAPLPPEGIWTSPADARGRPFQFRGIEAEIALRLGSEVDPVLAASLDTASASALVDACCVAIEIVDSRWVEGRQAPALARLADLQSHGALVLSDWKDWPAWRHHDWATQDCALQIGDAPVAHFTGSHSLGDPAWLLPVWLRHATRAGDTVPAGTVVTTGTWCGLVMAAAGDAVRVTFAGIGEVSVQL